ncbi:efflux RND transporter periplasmic adaptor subunit [Roseibium sp. SCP14]|uniref:efflux RND transporter periplasmic adaptor subunit n=1 Tax=Roseibium sp. SCP14 TaxID=3141375 RepID=UPI00333B40F9
MKHIVPVFSILAAVLISGCNPSSDASTRSNEAPVRAVKTVTAEAASAYRLRAYPAVLEPRQITPLAFEVGGRVGLVDLQIGQMVSEGDRLMAIEPKDYELQLQQAAAALQEARSTLENAQRDVKRRRRLFERGVVSQASLDEAETDLTLAVARVEQAAKSKELIEESLGDTKLTAPFDGFINSIDIESFQSVQPGTTALTLYRDDGLQAEILVNLDVVQNLSVDQPVSVAVSGRPYIQLSGKITEIAHRAPSVSAFPVIVTIGEAEPFLRSGVSVEIEVEVPVTDAVSAIALPLSALVTHLEAELGVASTGKQHRTGKVFVFEPATETLSLRSVVISGMNDFEMVVVGGISPGDQIVTAGVPFLQPGQRVRQWTSADHGRQS